MLALVVAPPLQQCVPFRDGIVGGCRRCKGVNSFDYKVDDDDIMESFVQLSRCRRRNAAVEGDVVGPPWAFEVESGSFDTVLLPVFYGPPSTSSEAR